VALQRVSARQGRPVDLNVTFFRNGQPADPYAIRYVDIYRSCVRDENLMARVTVADPGSLYPSPIDRVTDAGGTVLSGQYKLTFSVPTTFPQDIYFDVWRFIADEPGSGSVIGNLDDPDLLQYQANRFWVSPDGWYLDDGLETVRFTFEPLDMKFRKPEQRILEVSIVPVPLYDFNFNLVMPIIPQLQPSIRIETENNELLVDWEPAVIGLRMGAYKDSPFVVQYLLDTSRFLVGTYRYQILVRLPNGQSRTSEKFTFTVS
jgi:hypothetical protein